MLHQHPNSLNRKIFQTLAWYFLSWQVFQRMWRHSRRLLILDGAHVRILVKGTLLTATVKDANAHSVLLALMYCPTEDQKHWNIFIRMLKCLYLRINIIRSDEDEKIHEREEGSKTRVCVKCPDDLHFFRISFWADFIFLVLGDPNEGKCLIGSHSFGAISHQRSVLIDSYSNSTTINHWKKVGILDKFSKIIIVEPANWGPNIFLRRFWESTDCLGTQQPKSEKWNHPKSLSLIDDDSESPQQFIFDYQKRWSSSTRVLPPLPLLSIPKRWKKERQ